MPSYDPNLFNVDPYYDDFSEDKKHLRVMFRPGYGVQARELTQLQTILQNQIERFGSHVFDEGSIVLDGQITTNRVKFFRVNLDTGVTHTDFIGKNIYGMTAGGSKAYAKCVHTEGPVVGDPNAVVFFEYLVGGTGFDNGEVIVSTGANEQRIAATITGPICNGNVISVDRGVRFVEGYFVQNDAQSIGAYTLSGSYRDYELPTTSIGFTVNKNFVTAEDDTTLTDPAFGYYNYAAPGADRFQIDLVLSQRGYTASDTSTTDNFSREDFVEFMRMVSGDIVKIEKYPDYAMLEDTLARRTYDESGNYTVVPFDLNVRGATMSSSVVKAELGPGKAYIFGYEFETQGVTKLNLDKARTTRTVTRNFNRVSGPWTEVTLSGITGSVLSTTNIFEHNPVLIMVTGSSGQGGAGKTIVGEVGRARMRKVEPYSGNIFNLYLYDMSFTAGGDFSQVTRFFVRGVTNCDRHLFTVTGNAGLQGVNYSTLLWEVPDGSTVKSLDRIDIAYTTHEELAVTTLPTTFTITKPEYSDGFSIPVSKVDLPNIDVMVFDQRGHVMGGTAANVGGNLLLSIEGDATQSRRLFVMASVDYDTQNPSGKTKTLVTENITLTGSFSSLTADGRGLTSNTLYFNGLVDVVSVVGMTGYKDNGQTAMAPYFVLDNGQRDDMYDWSRMTMNPGVTGITGPYTATITRYSRTVPDEGEQFFTAKSYTGSDYSSDYIPSFTSKLTGKTYRLRDCVDFRPDRGTTTSHLTFDSTPPKGNEWIPTNSAANDNEFEYTHYLPRIDKVTLTRDRNFSLIKGVPSINPEPPSDNPNAMTLYAVTMNPYTFGESDVTIRQVENKRYTMRDIGELEKRIEAVEYYTTLNLLEQDAKSISIKDDAGDEMPKRGIVVDQFRGHIVTDNNDTMFAASIDYERNELRPPFTTKAFACTGGVASGMTGDSTENVFTLSRVSTEGEILSIVASGYEKINPFGVVSFLGTMSISPSSDSWFDDTRATKVKVNIDGENDNWQFGKGYGFGTRYNDWESIWFGKSIAESNSSFNNTTPSNQMTAKVDGVALNSIGSSSTINSIKKRVAEKSIVKDVLPMARQRDISITVKGMKPNTPFYVFCDNVYVTPYCKDGSQTKTDSKGEITNLVFHFNQPKITDTAWEEQNFPVGRHIIRVIGVDSELTNAASLINTPSMWVSSADALYVAEGSYDTMTESNVLSTRLPAVKRKSSKSEKVVSNLSEMLTSSGELVGYQEPISQVFYVDPNKYPSGIFVGFIDLYFKSKDVATNVPVTVDIKPTLNGYPHPSKVMPFGTSTLYSDSISASATRIVSGNTGFSRFNFKTPVYLLPGQEYAVCVSTNSPEFSLFTSSIGSLAIKDDEGDPDYIIAKQPAFRALFKTQNSGKIGKNENESLCMRVGVIKFQTSGSINFPVGTLFGGDTNVYNEVRINSSVALPEGCTYTVTLDGVSFEPNKNVIPPSRYLKLVSVSGNMTLNFTTTNAYVSPVFDIERSSVVLVKNQVNSQTNVSPGTVSYNGELEPINTGISSTYRTKARYITKQITLEPGVSAENVTVKMSLNNPTFNTGSGQLESSVKVFVRPLPVGGTDFSKVKYIELTPSDTNYSYGADDFREVTFSNISGDVTLPEFSAFAIKIVMFGDPDGAVYPKVRNLRVIAT